MANFLESLLSLLPYAGAGAQGYAQGMQIRGDMENRRQQQEMNQRQLLLREEAQRADEARALEMLGLAKDREAREAESAGVLNDQRRRGMASLEELIPGISEALSGARPGLPQTVGKATVKEAGAISRLIPTDVQQKSAETARSRAETYKSSAQARASGRGSGTGAKPLTESQLIAEIRRQRALLISTEAKAGDLLANPKLIPKLGEEISKIQTTIEKLEKDLEAMRIRDFLQGVSPEQAPAPTLDTSAIPAPVQISIQPRQLKR